MWVLPDNNADGAEGTIPYIYVDFGGFSELRLTTLNGAAVSTESFKIKGDVKTPLRT